MQLPMKVAVRRISASLNATGKVEFPKKNRTTNRTGSLTNPSLSLMAVSLTGKPIHDFPFAKFAGERASSRQAMDRKEISDRRFLQLRFENRDLRSQPRQ